jgi:ribose 5-phosphate isomerase B
MHSPEEAAALAEAFVSTPFSHDPRHQRRIDMLVEYERTGVAPPLPAPAADASAADQGTAG